MKNIYVWFSEEKKRWPTWWKTLSPLRKFGPTAGVFLWWILILALDGLTKRGGFTKDHLSMGTAIILLSLGGQTAGTALRFLFPVMLTGIVYDSMRYYSEYIRGEIHVAFPYEFDKRFFGITTSEGHFTPNEWLQRHTLPLLDLITGFFYLFFIGIYLAICIYHVFILPQRTTDPVLRKKTERLGPYVTWAFFWLNIIGYTTYYWFPAAPPWYVADHGLGPAQMDTLASPAGAIRFDQILGTHFFTGMYGRSADVFGAIPSLHVAYPLLSVFFAFQFGSLRAFSIFFYAIMCFSAVYLNHHYIIDLLWGSAYAVLIFVWVNAYSKRMQRKLT